jgi:uncharacterized RDD family membrane protein YckC
VTSAGRARPRGLLGYPAGLVSRAVAAGVDAVVVAGLGLVAQLCVGAARLLVTGPPFRYPDPPDWLTATGGTLIAVLYLTGSWVSSGRTVGDRLMGLRVTARTGRELGVPRALSRALLCLVFPLGLLWVPVSATRSSVQDLLVSSAVRHDWR